MSTIQHSNEDETKNVAFSVLVLMNFTFLLQLLLHQIVAFESTPLFRCKHCSLLYSLFLVQSIFKRRICF